MAEKPIRISFSLDAQDASYFRRLLSEARKQARQRDPAQVIEAARSLVARVRQQKRVPHFAMEAVANLETLVGMVEDKEYNLPKPLVDQVVGALAYFSHPEDLIPDHVPGLGFLDDAIMIKIVEHEFQHELWGYRKFCKFRDGAEQRPWTPVARQRLPGRLAEKRREVRAQIDKRKTRATFGW